MLPFERKRNGCKRTSMVSLVSCEAMNPGGRSTMTCATFSVPARDPVLNPLRPSKDGTAGSWRYHSAPALHSAEALLLLVQGQVLLIAAAGARLWPLLGPVSSRCRRKKQGPQMIGVQRGAEVKAGGHR